MESSWVQQYDKGNLPSLPSPPPPSLHPPTFTNKKRTSRSEMQKTPRTVRCILLTGSAWCTERKYVRRYTGTFDIFFRSGHRMRREEMEEHVQQRGQTGMEVCSRRGKDH